MANRILKSQLLHSERWNKCSLAAQNLFIRLIALVDDYGRFEANPRLLSSLAYPLGDARSRAVNVKVIEACVSELAGADLLDAYEVGGSRYLELKRWTERRRSASRYPDKQGSRAFAVNCQQMPATADNGGQLLSPPYRTVPNRTDYKERENGAGGIAERGTRSGEPSGDAAFAKQKLQAGLLLGEIKALEEQLKLASEPPRKAAIRSELQKKREKLRGIQEKQAKGTFEPET